VTEPLRRAGDNDRPLMDPAKYDRLSDLLGRFGSNKFSRETFWALMTKRGFTQDDVDAWLGGDRRRDAEKAEAEHNK
jgi:hypothetical protein